MDGLAPGGEVTRLQMATPPTGSAARLQKENFMSRAFEKIDSVTYVSVYQVTSRISMP